MLLEKKSRGRSSASAAASGVFLASTTRTRHSSSAPVAGPEVEGSASSGRRAFDVERLLWLAGLSPRVEALAARRRSSPGSSPPPTARGAPYPLLAKRRAPRRRPTRRQAARGPRRRVRSATKPWSRQAASSARANARSSASARSSTGSTAGVQASSGSAAALMRPLSPAIRSGASFVWRVYHGRGVRCTRVLRPGADTLALRGLAPYRADMARRRGVHGLGMPTCATAANLTYARVARVAASLHRLPQPPAAGCRAQLQAVSFEASGHGHTRDRRERAAGKSLQNPSPIDKLRRLELAFGLCIHR